VAGKERGYGDVERVREATDIVAIIGQYVALTPAGENLKGVCPFHSDTKPSMTVSPSKQLYYCFGCGEGGNVFNFVMRMEGLTFGEALRELARRAGIKLQAGGRSTPDESRRDRLGVVVVEAAKFYYETLRSSGEYAARAREYLRRRGLTDETVDEWKLGLAPHSWDEFLKRATRAGFEPAQVAEAGLAVPSKSGGGYYDRFRGRVVFPIRNASGKVVAFGGRVLDDAEEPKYLNSSNTPLYNKSATLYGLSHNRAAISKAGACVVVEGYLDLLGLYQVGIENVVATCGTALAEEGARILSRHAQDFVLLFDGDDAGVRAARRAVAALLPAGARRVRVGILPAGRDPFDVAMEGAEAAADAVGAAADWPDFLIEMARREHVGDNVGAELAVIREAGPLLKIIPDEMERTYWRRRIAERLGIPVSSVEVAGQRGRPDTGGASAGRPGTEHNLLRVIVQRPEVAAECMAEISPDDIEDEQVGRVLRVCAKLAKKGAFSAVELLDELDEVDAGMVTRLALVEIREEDAALAARLAVKALKQRALARRARVVREELAAAGDDYEEAAPAIRELVEEKRRHLKSNDTR
jgi:DNA primase